MAGIVQIGWVVGAWIVSVGAGELGDATGYREEAYRVDPAKEALLGCRLVPTYECFAERPRWRVGGETAGECCEACRGECVAYNHVAKAGVCELFDRVPRREVDYESGCSAGTVERGRTRREEERPNVVFLVVESTDGRAWTPGYQEDVIPLPNLRRLQENGTTFLRHYSNAPVCCPSRATFWSGRHAHKLPHVSAMGALPVVGAWNNYEGLPLNFTSRLDQLLYADGYDVLVSGKTDWVSGGHTETVRLDAWTKYVDFGYDVNATGGWYSETWWCASNGTVQATGSAHEVDWNVTKRAVSWGLAAASPWFLYSGHEIVHPPYATSQEWDDKIDRSKIRVPAWRPLDELHPCDFEATMRKGCAPDDANASAFYAVDRRREVRAKYYAMIAEYDAMVGMYLDAFFGSAVFVVTSDHGDMQMEHQQFYKMTPYDASARVPMIIHDPRRRHQPQYVAVPTQLIDIFPTILELAGLDPDQYYKDGDSVLPLLDRAPFGRDSVVTQFHGADIGMSWFAVITNVSNTTYKLVVWGSGEQHPNLVFDLDADPDENHPLNDPDLQAALQRKLRHVVDYPAVARDVARYGRLSLERWIQLQGDDWRDAIHAPGLGWDASFDRNVSASFAAIDAFRRNLNLSYIRPCRHDLVHSPDAPPPTSPESPQSMAL